MKERDMYYGFGGFLPIPNQNIYTTSNQINPNNINYLEDFNKRIEKLERQIKRFDQRLTRLETPYVTNNYNNEPDNNMYMM